MLQGGSLAHCLLTEVLPQPPVDQTVQEALEGDGQGLREREGAEASAAFTCPWATRCCRSAANPIALSTPERSHLGSARVNAQAGWHRDTGGGFPLGVLN